MATTMDASWFQTHRKLCNVGKNILKLTNKYATLDEICEHFGPWLSKNGWRYDQKFKTNIVKKIEIIRGWRQRLDLLIMNFHYNSQKL
jgi:hypothetical protein